MMQTGSLSAESCESGLQFINKDSQLHFNKNMYVPYENK